MKKPKDRTIEEFEAWLHSFMVAFHSVPVELRIKALRNKAMQLRRAIDDDRSRKVRNQSRNDPAASGC